jgi:hypothetical protein
MKKSTMPGMVDGGTIRVASGLRPKVRNAQKKDQTGSKPAQITQMCANPLDRLCELIVDWRILEDVSKDRKARNSSTFSDLPKCYIDYQYYLTSWEPLLIEEIKANILSNLPLSTRRQSKKGTAMVSNQGSNRLTSQLINLNCHFTQSSIESENKEKVLLKERYVIIMMTSKVKIADIPCGQRISLY